MCATGCVLFFFCFKQKTAYEMRISDWSSDVCSSDLDRRAAERAVAARRACQRAVREKPVQPDRAVRQGRCHRARLGRRSEEHTSELQSLMRISYAAFCLKKKKHKTLTIAKSESLLTCQNTTSRDT